MLELIVVILFLAIASAICMRIFAAAFLLSQRGSDLSDATNRTRNIAEQFKASDSAQAFLSRLQLPTDDETAVLHYDKDWKLVPDGGVYSIEMTLGGERLVTATITTRRAGKAEPILTVTTKKFFG